MFGRWECSCFSKNRIFFFSFLRKEKPADLALMTSSIKWCCCSQTKKESIWTASIVVDSKKKFFEAVLMVVKDKVLVSVGDIESAWEIWETPQRMYESVTMVNMKFLRQRFFSKQDARGDERVSALRQDGEDFQRICSGESQNDWSWSVTAKSAEVESLTTTLSRETPPLTMIDLTIFFRQKLKRDLNSSLKRLMLRKRICF